MHGRLVDNFQPPSQGEYEDTQDAPLFIGVDPARGENITAIRAYIKEGLMIFDNESIEAMMHPERQIMTATEVRRRGEEREEKHNKIADHWKKAWGGITDGYLKAYQQVFLKDISMQGRVFKIAGNRWKTTREYNPWIEENLTVYWGPWQTNTKELINLGWDVTAVRNNFTDKEKLYIRDPKTKLMGAGKMDNPYKHVYLDHFCHEKNQRISKKWQTVPVENIVELNEKNIGAALEVIADIQRQTKKPKRKKRSVAEIITLIRNAA